MTKAMTLACRKKTKLVCALHVSILLTHAFTWKKLWISTYFRIRFYSDLKHFLGSADPETQLGVAGV